MSTPTTPSTLSAPPPGPTEATLGARLAAASRQAQGFPSTVSDPAVLAELRGTSPDTTGGGRDAAKLPTLNRL